MAEFVNPIEQENPSRRVILSRKNTPEEKRRQRQEWRKKMREQKMANSIATTTAHQEANDVVPCIPEAQGKQPASSNQFFDDVVASIPEAKEKQPASSNQCFVPNARSRGAMMVQMARADSIVKHEQPSRLQLVHQNVRYISKQAVNGESKFEPKELRPEHIEYSSENPVGSGSFGQCFLARYRGIEVIVKQMTHSKTTQDQERARKDLLREAKVVSALGDQPSLPMIFGVVTKNLPLCLVMQFHGVKGLSVNLHQAADANMLTPTDCISIFIKICSALGHVHFKGYLHNDLKANNVVLEQTSASEEFNPIVIDFGKSTKASSLQSSRKVNALEYRGKSYLAPEVRSERLYSVASDIYSLGRMLKAISYMVAPECYQRVRALVKEATKEKPSERPSLEVFSKKIAEVKF